MCIVSLVKCSTQTTAVLSEYFSLRLKQDGHHDNENQNESNFKSAVRTGLDLK